MNSHTLTTKYPTVAETPRANLIGQDYSLPDFEITDSESLKGYRVALITTHGPELPEFDVL